MNISIRGDGKVQLHAADVRRMTNVAKLCDTVALIHEDENTKQTASEAAAALRAVLVELAK